MPREIAIVWPRTQPWPAPPPLLDACAARSSPTARLAASEAESASLGALVPWIADKPALAGRPTAYVCEHGRCELRSTNRKRSPPR